MTNPQNGEDVLKCTGITKRYGNQLLNGLPPFRREIG